MSTHNSPSRQNLRRMLRKKRRNLSLQAQKAAASGLVKVLRQHPVFLRSKHIACYLAADGEISPKILIETAWKMGKSIYLPILDPLKQGSMRFARYTPKSTLQKNQFNILEPTLKDYHAQSIHPRLLSLVLLPLVGFDDKGGRLGMGGGFYDRTFAFKRLAKNTRPTLIGLAHECQQVSHIPMEVWDISLSYIATGHSFYKAQL